MLNELAKEVLAINEANGWHDEEHEFGTYMALIHSEVSEALEASRVNKKADWAKYDQTGDFKACIKNSVEDELSDVIIRTLDVCAMYGIDIDKHVKAKMEYNKTRGYHHGGKAY